MSSIGEAAASNHTYILVTGANIGLGLGICYRLIDDFLNTAQSTAQLTLIFTTRSAKKGSDTLQLLQSHLSKHKLASTTSPLKQHRVHFHPENVELTNLLSVRAVAVRLLRSTIPKLDTVILNAGIGGFIGVDWPLTIWSVMTDLVQATTFPTFKLSSAGSLTSPQLPPLPNGKTIDEPPLAEIFCANVFGHYMLVHWLVPLLQSRSEETPGRIIWMSSVEIAGTHFNPKDLQGLRSRKAYEHTKRLIDLLSLTAQGQPATSKSVSSFLTPQESEEKTSQRNNHTTSPSKPTIHVVHPGILATTILPLLPILTPAWVVLCFLVRLVGSPWHTVTAYAAAYAPVWLALASTDEIKEKQGVGGGTAAVKWGTAVNRMGDVWAAQTLVDGWGLDGSIRPVEWWGGSWAKRRGATDPTKEDVESFVQDGARVWTEMEQLRRDWEERIESYEKSLD